MNYHPYTHFNNRNIRNRGSGDLSQHLKILMTELGDENHGTDWRGKFCCYQVLKFIISCIPYNILLFRFARLKNSLSKCEYECVSLSAEGRDRHSTKVTFHLCLLPILLLSKGCLTGGPNANI